MQTISLSQYHLEQKRLKGVHKNALPKEENLHKAVWRIFQLTLQDSVLVWHSANGKRRNVIDAVNLKRMGVVKGTPDFCLIWQDDPNAPLTAPPKTGFLELKRSHRHKLSREQHAWRVKCEALGVRFAVASCIEDVRGILDVWRVPQKGRRT